MIAKNVGRIFQTWKICELICKGNTVTKKTDNYTAFIVLTTGGRTFVKTLNPQIHLISGNRDNSLFETWVPHLKQE